MSVGLGVSVRKVGISLFARGNGSFIHPANSVTQGRISAQAWVEAPLTLGSTFSTPGLPFADMSVGVNLKSIQILGGGVALTGGGNGVRVDETGSGFGFDIGMQTKITPLISLGAVIRNLSASVDTKTKSQAVTIAPDGTITDAGAETEVKSSDTLAPETGIGVGISLPLIGTLIAVDAENYSVPGDKSYTDTHIGLEQGLFFNALMLRAGYYTDGPTEDTFYTYGFGLNLGPANIGVAAANSVNDSINSVSEAQLGVAF